MAKKTVKCPECKKENEKDIAVLVKSGSANKYYCPECIEKIEQKVANPRKTTVDSKKQCTKCGSWELKSDLIKVSGGSYCPQCYPERRKEADLYIAVSEYLCKQHKFDQNKMAIATAQIKRFKEEHNMTLNGIYMTMQYYVELKNGDLNRDGIGIIPYYYEEAKEFYKQRGEVTKYANTIDRSEWITKRVIKTIPEEHEPRLKNPLLTMEDIDVD